MERRKARQGLQAALAWGSIFLTFFVAFIFALAVIPGGTNAESAGNSWTIAAAIAGVAMCLVIRGIQVWSQRQADQLTLTIASEITVARPIEQVFAFLADVTNEPHLMPQIKQSAWTSPGPIGPGSTYRQTIRALGRTFEMDWTVIAVQPPYHLSARGIAGKQVQVSTTTLARVPTGTLVSAAITLPTTILNVPLHPFTRVLFKPTLNASLKRLKGVLEA